MPWRWERFSADIRDQVLCQGAADHLVGLVVFTILTLHGASCFSVSRRRSGGSVQGRLTLCSRLFRLVLWHPFARELAATDRWRSWDPLPLVGIGRGCLGSVKCNGGSTTVLSWRWLWHHGVVRAFQPGPGGACVQNTISDVGAEHLGEDFKSRDVQPLPALALSSG